MTTYTFLSFCSVVYYNLLICSFQDISSRWNEPRANWTRVVYMCWKHFIIVEKTLIINCTAMGQQFSPWLYNVGWVDWQRKERVCFISANTLSVTVWGAAYRFLLIVARNRPHRYIIIIIYHLKGLVCFVIEVGEFISLQSIKSLLPPRKLFFNYYFRKVRTISSCYIGYLRVFVYKRQ